MVEAPDVAAPRSRKQGFRLGWQARWIVTVAGAVAMTIIAGILVWSLITAEHPLAQPMPGTIQTARHSLR
jgi:hypothetical protein